MTSHSHLLGEVEVAMLLRLWGSFGEMIRRVTDLWVAKNGGVTESRLGAERDTVRKANMRNEIVVFDRMAPSQDINQ